MIALTAALLLASGTADLDCRRVRSDPELQPCELQRRETDVLAALKRPAASELGSDAVRFSSEPSLGGRAVVVEAVKYPDGRGRVGIFWAYGHPLDGWKRAGSARMEMSASAYRKLAATADRALASYRLPSVGEKGESIVCTDGPGYLTERVRQRTVVTLAGSCPPERNMLHANRTVAAAMLSLACPAMLADEQDNSGLRRDCAQQRALLQRIKAQRIAVPTGTH